MKSFHRCATAKEQWNQNVGKREIILAMHDLFYLSKDNDNQKIWPNNNFSWIASCGHIVSTLLVFFAVLTVLNTTIFSVNMRVYSKIHPTSIKMQWVPGTLGIQLILLLCSMETFYIVFNLQQLHRNMLYIQKAIFVKCTK